MLTIDAREAKQKFGRLLDEARREPITICKHGRPVVVLMAIEDYEYLKSLEKLFKVKKVTKKTSIKKSPKRVTKPRNSAVKKKS
jgi:prevent-host-death family protein